MATQKTLLASLSAILVLGLADGFVSPASRALYHLRPRGGGGLLLDFRCSNKRHGMRSGMRSLAAMDVSVTLERPLGIVFEEVSPGEAEGVVVAKIEPGGNADKDGKILVGDKLIATSAVVMDDSNSALVGLGGSGAKTNWSRKMIPVGKATFQTIMGAIGSNTGRWGYTDVRLTLRRTANSIARSTNTIVRKQEGGDAADAKEMPLAKPLDDWQE